MPTRRSPCAELLPGWQDELQRDFARSYLARHQIFVTRGAGLEGVEPSEGLEAQREGGSLPASGEVVVDFVAQLTAMLLEEGVQVEPAVSSTCVCAG